MGKKNCNKQVWKVIITKKTVLSFSAKTTVLPKNLYTPNPRSYGLKLGCRPKNINKNFFFQQLSALGLKSIFFLDNSLLQTLFPSPQRMGELAILSLFNESSISKSQLLIPFTKDVLFPLYFFLESPISFGKPYFVLERRKTGVVSIARLGWYRMGPPNFQLLQSWQSSLAATWDSPRNNKAGYKGPY